MHLEVIRIVQVKTLTYQIERCPSLRVLSHSIGTLDKKLFDYPQIALPHRLMQRCLSPNILGINLDRRLHQQVTHADGRAHVDSPVQR